MIKGAHFFAGLWNLCANIPKLCFENPVMHGYGQRAINALAPDCPMGKLVQKIQPCDFGHMETKCTGLYLRGLPRLTPTKIVRNEMALLTTAQRNRVHYASPGPDRWKERSRTLPGIAKAMADQWGNLNE
jgi:hypothetical protein